MEHFANPIRLIPNSYIMPYPTRINSWSFEPKEIFRTEISKWSDICNGHIPGAIYTRHSLYGVTWHRVTDTKHPPILYIITQDSMKQRSKIRGIRTT